LSNLEQLIQIWVKFEIFPYVGKIWVNSSRLNQLWADSISSI